MTVRTRFAPSPTGKLHIGNVRAAIYNWLYARHYNGKFLLRIEDTDRQRSTDAAIEGVLDAMDWLGLDCDEDHYYQSQHCEEHLAAASKLLESGAAYRAGKGGGDSVVLFRIPWDCEGISSVETVGETELKTHPDQPVRIKPTGVNYAQVSRKGKPMPSASCLAGFKDMVLYDESDRELFALNDHIEEILNEGANFEFEGVLRMRFVRRQVVFHDMVKGRLSKTLDSMKDFVIVRSDGSPVFHLANVCDDSAQKVTHIIRGDDHVENSFRHIFLFQALGEPVPRYGHLPMITNHQGKPYSKRDGDAFVGDFRENGFLPQAIFNYLALLGWSPGDDRERMDRQEMVELFDLDRVQSSPAQVDLGKLAWMNGQYMSDLSEAEYAAGCIADLKEKGLWHAGISEDYARRVFRIMGDRIKIFSETSEQTNYFFEDEYEYDKKAVAKRLGTPEALQNLSAMRDLYAELKTFDEETSERALRDQAEKLGVGVGDLVHPVRVAVSGSAVGPSLFEMLAILGQEKVVARIDRALKCFADS